MWNAHIFFLTAPTKVLYSIILILLHYLFGGVLFH
jgi:hypothetical protein